ncbi:MAG: tRNA glutamyl-Q(34) synthetase GluQRS [Gammaproteobacteria bacterium]|nr:tRNA glutamyl-Q(34) synthetase GluQRS [Gammaproteobacteria bacterium]MBT7308313.1 tRNA glutamyl-Q(34) synthetase GluQRS [Gammaproteobacteria bacterium]
MPPPPSQTYRGRFAPTPSGDLHFGSLITAVGSYLEAKHHHGEWLVRIEDLDIPRTTTGAADAILHTLEKHHLFWDQAVLYQEHRGHHYQQAMALLGKTSRLFGCHCSRRSLRQTPCYPGHCRAEQLSLDHHAVRLRIAPQTLALNDLWQGRQQWALEQEVGDFVIRRADGLCSYQLAVVVDDHLQGVTHVVRGSDLLDSTPKQLYLQQQLHYPSPHYGHLPIALGSDGRKLSKQNFASPLDNSTVTDNLFQALLFLGQKTPVALRRSSPETLWQWALEEWQSQRVPHQMAIPVESISWIK